MGRKHVVISGYYGFSNAGDEAVLSAIISELQNARPNEIDITVLSASPEDTASTYGVAAVPRMSRKDVYKAIDDCDMLISGGGSLLQDVTSIKSLLYYLWIINTALKKHKKVVILGQGIGPLKHGISRWMVSKILNRVDAITVRDNQSAELLKRIGVHKPDITTTADPTLLLNSANRRLVDALLNEVGINPDEPIIAISLRDWGSAAGLEEALVSSIKEITTAINAKPLFITMHLPHDKRLSQITMQSIDNGVIQPRQWTAEELVGVLGRCSMVIGMRLHALILAAVGGTPSIGIAYDPKVEQFCASVGMPSVSLNGVLQGRLVVEAIRTWSKLAEQETKLTQALPSMRTAARLNITKALDVLDRD